MGTTVETREKQKVQSLNNIQKSTLGFKRKVILWIW